MQHLTKLKTATLDGILADTDALTSILLKHVVTDSEIDSVSAFAANGADCTSIGGDSLSVSLQNFSQTVDGASDEVAYDSASEMLVGGTNSSQPGLTLYVFDSDLGTSGSTCNDGCATTWPPVVVDDAEVDNIPGLSLIHGDDGSSQAAFKGRPLYFYANDTAAGDTNGQAVNNAWWQVDQEQVELQIQGSGVTTFDLYGTNGVIHVIDTVITN